MVLVLISGVLQVIYSNRHHGFDACLITSFNYGGKKTRDIGRNCRCHLSNIITDSIVYDSMGWGITCFVLFFCKGDNYYLPRHKTDRFSCLIIIIPMDLGKP